MNPEVDHFIAKFNSTTAAKLTELRKLIISVLPPEASELISYGMPSYKLGKKPIIYFNAYTNHIGIYAIPNAHKFFAKRIVKYKSGKGSFQIPLNEPLPSSLIIDMIKFNLKQLSAE